MYMFIYIIIKQCVLLPTIITMVITSSHQLTTFDQYVFEYVMKIVFIYVCIYVCISFIYIYIYIYINIFFYLYIYKYILHKYMQYVCKMFFNISVLFDKYFFLFSLLLLVVLLSMLPGNELAEIYLHQIRKYLTISICCSW